jgi:hypothetical protein
MSSSFIWNSASQFSELDSQADSCVLSYGPLNAQQVLGSLGALHYSKAVFTKSNSQCKSSGLQQLDRRRELKEWENSYDKVHNAYQGFWVQSSVLANDLFLLLFLYLVLGLCNWAEFSKVAFRTGVGCVVMGFIGFFVKLLFIPINNIIIGSA